MTKEPETNTNHCWYCNTPLMPTGNCPHCDNQKREAERKFLKDRAERVKKNFHSKFMSQRFGWPL